MLPKKLELVHRLVNSKSKYLRFKYMLLFFVFHIVASSGITGSFIEYSSHELITLKKKKSKITSPINLEKERHKGSYNGEWENT